MARRVKKKNKITPINKLLIARALAGRLNRGASGARAFKNIPKIIVMK